MPDQPPERALPRQGGVYVQRLVTEMRSDDRGGDSQPLQTFFERPALVVLGDPGMGKTTAFERAAREESDAVCTTVRSLLRTPAERWRGLTLYIDALDEHRARTRAKGSVIDQLVLKLGELGTPKIRLSCRVADWERGGDKAALADASADGEVTILRLEPLTDADVLYIAGSRGHNPEQSLREAEARGLGTLLQNPQTLTMLLDVVGEGGWPATRQELFEKACRLLLRIRPVTAALRGRRGMGGSPLRLV